ncbi:MAG TPA: NADPH:quinone oxidoreductase [Deltaproteobacteria bacterium]|nr:NADPH:quinone oxidoreductase [Deltaproteobacteria bacterium]
MKAIVVDAPGDERVLRLGELPSPRAGPEDLRLRVVATGVNRADLLQRQGLYPPPPGASAILGLECAGEVVEIGSEVVGWRKGERAMALLAGGGYAEEVVVPAVCAMPVPDAFSWDEAAATPEVFLTVFLNVFELGALSPGGSVLVHGGGSGIGTAAIALVREAGGRVLVTAGSDAKCERCRQLGASLAVNYKTQNFAAEVRKATGGRGVEVVLDSIGAPYLADNLASLAVGGRLVLIGLMGGAKAEIALGELLLRRLQVIGSTLRARPAHEKGLIIEHFLERFGEALRAGRLRPLVDRVLPLAEAAEAHRAMKASEHFGKIVLRVA